MLYQDEYSETYNISVLSVLIPFLLTYGHLMHFLIY